MKRILDGMKRTMMAVNPPRYTALEGLQKAETASPFKILIHPYGRLLQML